MEDYIEERQSRIPMNTLKRDVDAVEGQSGHLNLNKVATHAESLRANPPIRPLRCIVWHDEGMLMR